MQGRLVDLSFTRSGSARLAIETNEPVGSLYDRLKDVLVRVDIKRWRDKRSLDANAYYWVLLSKLADALDISNAKAHNLMLRRYGQLDYIDGKVVYVILPETESAEEKALESETFHLKPTSSVRAGNDGLQYRTYHMLRGSSTYDTKEMSRLINGLADECRALGIETMTAEELASMLDEKNYL